MPKRTNNNDTSRGRWWCALQGMGSVDRRWSEGGATMNRHILKRKGGPVGSYMSNGGGGGSGCRKWQAVHAVGRLWPNSGTGPMSAGGRRRAA
jgi:hypothetical protein